MSIEKNNWILYWARQWVSTHCPTSVVNTDYAKRPSIERYLSPVS